MQCKFNGQETETYVENTDVCFNCTNQDKCPLIRMLQNEKVFLGSNSVLVDKCYLMKQEV